MSTTIIRHYIAVLVIILLPMVAVATPATLSVEDFTIEAGETKEMLIDLNNPDTQVTLVQFDLRLPTGLSIAVEDDEFVIDIAGRTTWQKHSLQANAVGEITRFLLASNSNKVISGTSGAIISVMLTASNSFNGGDIKLEEQLIVDPDAGETYPSDYTYSIAGPSIIDSPATLSVEDFSIEAGETKEMLIDLNNPNTQVTLVQFDLSLPTGLSIAVQDDELAIDIAGRTTWQKHSLQANAVGEITRFLLASNSNKVISGTSGAIISIILKAANTFNGGDIKLEEQLIVAPDASETYPDDYTYTIGGAIAGKCATPTITMNNGTLTFTCETAGAVCHYEITRAGEGNTVMLSSTSDYIVSVYAAKAGYEDSDIASATVTLKQGDVNADGVVSITDAVGVVNIILNGEASAPAMDAVETDQEPE